MSGDFSYLNNYAMPLIQGLSQLIGAPHGEKRSAFLNGLMGISPQQIQEQQLKMKMQQQQLSDMQVAGQQRQAATQAWNAPSSWQPAKIPITPQVGSPDYANAAQDFNATSAQGTGTPSLMESVPQNQRPLVNAWSKTDPVGALQALGQASVKTDERIRPPELQAQELQLAQARQRPIGPQSPVGKAADDLAKKLITKQEYDAIVKKETNVPDSTGSGWQFYTDPNGGPDGKAVPFRMNSRTGEAQLLNGQPYTPQGIQRIASGGVGAPIAPSTVKLFAEQALAGDFSVFASVGRNQAARQQIAEAVDKLAQERGYSGADLAALKAAYGGDLQAQRTIGQRTGAINVSGNEAEGVANLVNDAYSKLPREQFRPFNQLRSMFETQTSSPEQAAAYMADFSLQTAYARALNPQGVPRESDISKAGELLNGAQSQDAHRAVVDQIMKEIRVIKNSTGAAKLDAINGIRQQRGFGPMVTPAGAGTQGAAAPQSGSDIDALVNQYKTKR